MKNKKSIFVSIFILIVVIFLSNCSLFKESFFPEYINFETQVKEPTKKLWESIWKETYQLEEKIFSPYATEFSCVLVVKNQLENKLPTKFCKLDYKIIEIDSKEETLVLEQILPEENNISKGNVFVPIVIITEYYSIFLRVKNYYYHNTPKVRFYAQIIDFFPGPTNMHYCGYLKYAKQDLKKTVSAWATDDFLPRKYLPEDLKKNIIQKRMDINDIVVEETGTGNENDPVMFRYRLVIATDDSDGQFGNFFLTLPNSYLTDLNSYNENLEMNMSQYIRKHLNPLNIISISETGKLLGVLKEGNFKKKIYEEFFKDIDKTIYVN